MTYSALTPTSRKTISDFGRLSKHEKRFLKECQEGTPSDFDIINSKPDPNVTIQAGLIRYMLLGGCEEYKPSVHGIRIFGANIVGELDLENCHSTLGLTLINCAFDTVINALNCNLSHLILSASQTLGLNAQGINVKSHIFLSDGFTAKGVVSLSGASVGGVLSCSNGTFENEKGHALNAQAINVKGDIFLRNGFAAKGVVSLAGASVGGQLDCIKGTFENEKGHALNAQDINVKGDIFLRNGFTAKGEVSLAGASVGGQLSCSNGMFENEIGHALNAQGINVKRDIFLSDGFTAKREVSLSGASVGGQLDCNNGTFENENGHALNAQGINVKDDIFLRNGFTAKGEVSLAGASVGGQLDCIKGTFENENGHALNAENINVKGHILLRDRFKAKGEVSLLGASVGGQLACSNGTFENENGLALNAQNMILKSALFFKDITCLSGTIDFSFADVGVLSDDYESWPKDRFFLNGLTYKTIIDADITCERRITWLEGHQTKEFEPQPYEQLAKVLRELGHRRDGSLVLEAMEKNLRPDIRKRIRAGQDGDHDSVFNSIWLDLKFMFACVWDTALGLFVGYGYRPSHAFLWSLALVSLTTFISYQTWHKGDFVPNSDIVLVNSEWRTYAKDREGNPAQKWSNTSETGRDYETFNPFSYAVDVFVPIIDFGQESAWAPSTERGWWGQQLYWLRWLIKTLGWIITALGAAAVTGIIRQDR